MKKIGRTGIIAILIILFSTQIIWANEHRETDMGLDSLLSDLETQAMDDLMEGNGQSIINKKGNHLSFRELIGSILEGNLDLNGKTIGGLFLETFFSDIFSLLRLMSHMLLIIILSAFFKTLASNFNQKSVVEIGFYVCFIAIFVLLISSFKDLIFILSSLLIDVNRLIEAILPLILSLLTISGRSGTAMTYGPFLFMAIDFILVFLGQVFLPILTVASMFQVVNYISEKELFTKFAELIRKSLSWVLKITAMVFMAILTLQGLVGPSVDGAVNQTAKMAVTVVPVVGPVMSEAVDSIMIMTKALKSGTMVALVIVSVMYLLSPLLKMAAFVLVYKGTAALMQPIGEERIINAIDGTGKFAALALGAGLMIALMIIFMVILFLSV